MVRNYKRKTEDSWSKQDLIEALTSIKECKLKINEAAQIFGISRATLYRHYQKFVLAKGTFTADQIRSCGGNPILTRVEEDVFEKTIKDLRGQGFTVTPVDIKRICFEYCDVNGIPNQFNQVKCMASDDWYYGFVKRHPDIKILMGRKADSVPGDGEKDGEKVETGKTSSGEKCEAPMVIPKEPSAGRLKKSLKRLSRKSGGKKHGVRKATSSSVPSIMDDDILTEVIGNEEAQRTLDQELEDIIRSIKAGGEDEEDDDEEYVKEEEVERVEEPDTVKVEGDQDEGAMEFEMTEDEDEYEDEEEEDSGTDDLEVGEEEEGANDDGEQVEENEVEERELEAEAAKIEVLRDDDDDSSMMSE